MPRNGRNSTRARSGNGTAEAEVGHHNSILKSGRDVCRASTRQKTGTVSAWTWLTLWRDGHNTTHARSGELKACRCTSRPAPISSPCLSSFAVWPECVFVFRMLATVQSSYVVSGVRSMIPVVLIEETVHGQPDDGSINSLFPFFPFSYLGSTCLHERYQQLVINQLLSTTEP
jgi:hypothetical protein